VRLEEIVSYRMEQQLICGNEDHVTSRPADG
jgi:hypothetical protein